MFSDVSQKFNDRQLAEPLVVVHELRNFIAGNGAFDNSGNHFAMTFHIRLRFLDRKQRTFHRLAGRIADQTGAATKQNDTGQPGSNAADHHHDGKQVSNRQRRRRGIEADIKATLFFIQMRIEFFKRRAVMKQTAPLKFFNERMILCRFSGILLNCLCHRTVP